MHIWLLQRLRRALRPGRDRLIARQMADFARIDPALYGDIGLPPQGFREAAEAIADAQLARWAAQDAATRARLERRHCLAVEAVSGVPARPSAGPSMPV